MPPRASTPMPSGCRRVLWGSPLQKHPQDVTGRRLDLQGSPSPKIRRSKGPCARATGAGAAACSRSPWVPNLTFAGYRTLRRRGRRTRASSPKRSAGAARARRSRALRIPSHSTSPALLRGAARRRARHGQAGFRPARLSPSQDNCARFRASSPRANRLHGAR
jgi:hypothetical protein